MQSTLQNRKKIECIYIVGQGSHSEKGFLSGRHVGGYNQYFYNRNDAVSGKHVDIGEHLTAKKPDFSSQELEEAKRELRE